MTKIRVAAAIAFVALVLVVAGLSMRPTRAQELATARVSNVSGRLAVRGGQEAAVSYLQLNSVVAEGDTFWTDTAGQAEIELPRGAWVRLAQQTKVEILSLRQAAELRLWQGSLYCQVKNEFGRVLTVRTPDGDVVVRPGSVARIELGDQAAGVRVYYGQAEVMPLSGSPVSLDRGQRCRLVSGQLEGAPAAFDLAPVASDPFDQYQSKRAGYLATYREPGVLTKPLIGAYELAGRGDWVREGDEDYWIPDQEPGWRPYTDGYWSYVDDAGPTWVDEEPWGYTTSHYGRWDYLDDREAWGWIPDDDWGPSYVAWGGCERDGDEYIGWAPLGPDDPYDGWSVSYDQLDYWDSGSPADDYWTFCPRDDFYYNRAAYYDSGPSVYLSYTDISYGLPSYGGFRPYRDFYRDCGAPRYLARGLVVDSYGYVARDTVFRVERGFPRARYGLFQDRFGFAADRDLRWARDVSPIERYQRFRRERFADADILRGPAVARSFYGNRRFGGGRGAGDRWGSPPFWDGGGRRRDRIVNLAAYSPGERLFRESRRQRLGRDGFALAGSRRFLGEGGRPFNRASAGSRMAGRTLRGGEGIGRNRMALARNDRFTGERGGRIARPGRGLDPGALRGRGRDRVAQAGSRFLGNAGQPFDRAGRVDRRGARGDRRQVASLPIGPAGTRRQLAGGRQNGRIDRRQLMAERQNRTAPGMPRAQARAQRDLRQDRFTQRGPRAARVAQRDRGQIQRQARASQAAQRQAMAGARGRNRGPAAASPRLDRQARVQRGSAQRQAQARQRQPRAGREARPQVAARQQRQVRQARQAAQRARPGRQPQWQQRTAREVQARQPRAPRQAQPRRQAFDRQAPVRAQRAQRQVQARPQRPQRGFQAQAQGQRPQRQFRAQRPERQAVQRQLGGGQGRSRVSQTGFQIPSAQRRQVRSQGFERRRPAESRPQISQRQPQRERPSLGGLARQRQQESRPSFGGEARRQRAAQRPSFGGGEAIRQRAARQSQPSFGGGGFRQRAQRQAQPSFGDGGAFRQRAQRQAQPSFGGGGGGGRQRVQRQAQPSFGGGEAVRQRRQEAGGGGGFRQRPQGGGGEAGGGRFRRR